MIKKKVIAGAEDTKLNEFFCEGCQHGKLHRLPFKRQNPYEKQFETGECMYADLCGPFPQSLGGAKYFLPIKDRKSSYRFVRFLKHKSDAC